MSSGKLFAALALSLALLTGCGRNASKLVVPPEAEAPQLPPSRMAAALPAVPPAFPGVIRQTVKLDATTPPEEKTEVATEQPHHPPKHHARPTPEEAAKSAPAQTSAESPQVAASQPPEMTPLGQLSTPNNSDAADRHSVSEQIDATENGLNAIKRSLSSEEQKTVVLIRSYIARARDALKADDLDGATNLSSKAAQLLQELTKH